jgi:hypothetical protein
MVNYNDADCSSFHCGDRHDLAGWRATILSMFPTKEATDIKRDEDCNVEMYDFSVVLSDSEWAQLEPYWKDADAKGICYGGR